MMRAILPPRQQRCSSLRSRLPFPQGAEAKPLPRTPNEQQVSADGSSSLALENSPEQDLGTKPSGPKPRVSGGKGGCTPWAGCAHSPRQPCTQQLPGPGGCPLPPTSSPTHCPGAARPPHALTCVALAPCERASPSFAASCSRRGCRSSIPTDFFFFVPLRRLQIVQVTRKR